MKDSGVEWIGSVPIDFEILPVKYVSQLLRGKFSHRPRNDERYYGGKYPFIQTGDIVSSGKYITNFNDTLNELGYSVSKEFPIDTLVMVITGHNTGKVSILKIVSCFPDSIIGFSPNNKTSEEYLYFIFLTLIEELQKTSIKSTQMNLNIDRVGNIKIPLPSISQQKEIIKFINKENILIDKTISVEEKRIKLLKEYRQSLISEVVTGKRKVVEDNYPIIKNSLSVTLPYKILNPKYEKKVFKTSSGETITTQTGEEYLKPKKELIDFLNKELSNLVTTKNQKDSIERFFKESFFRLKHSLPFKGSYEHKDWNILKGKDGSILSNYYFTSGIMEDMKPNWERFIFKLNGEIDEFTDNIHEDNFIEKFRIYR